MRDKTRRALVCVKIIKIKNIPKKEREATKLEVDLLRRLNHPNIVRYMDSFLSKNGESLCICMEYCDGGDLASQIKAARRNLFSESKILHWFVQMALGLHYMHTNKVLHRDLKTQNVFLLGNGRLVLGDLGISKVLDGTMDFAQTCIGTPYYMSPEIFKNKPYSYKSDVWALGCVLYEMTTLNHAFDASSLNGLAQKIIKGKYPPIHHKYSKFLRDLITQMLQIEPRLRPDLDQILRKPFIKKHTINFFMDVISRPSTQALGEGTMIVRAAIGGGVGDAAMNADMNVIGLKQQLKELDMADAMAEAMAPKRAPVDPVAAKMLAKEQAGALRREEEHKSMVEAALEKLRIERENRLRDRAAAAGNAPSSRPEAKGAPISEKRAGVFGGIAAAAGKAAPPSLLQRGPSPVQAAPQPLRREAEERRRSGESEREREREKERDRERERDREQERERIKRINEDRAAALDRAAAMEKVENKRREENRLREEAAAKQKMDARRALDDAAARRDQQREKEKQRQREEVEELKRAKLEFDRRALEREKSRDERKTEERRLSDESKRSHADDKHTPDVHSSRSSSTSADSKDDGSLSARDKVLMRKKEKLAQEEAEKMEVLRLAEEENKRIRLLASNQRHQQYQGQGGAAVIPGASASPASTEEDDDDLASKLKEATRGKQARYGAPAAQAAPAAADPKYVDDYDAESSDDEGEEEGLWTGKRVSSSNALDEEEDIHRREEELEAELNFATLRVEELKRTLHETITYASSLAPAAAVAAVAKGPDLEEDEGLYDDIDDDAEERAGGGLSLADPNAETPRRLIKVAAQVGVKESPYSNLADPPSPNGRLGDRIHRLRQRCVEALGREAFQDAYDFLRDHDDDGVEDEWEEEKSAQMRLILGESKCLYAPLLEQLIFMEMHESETW